MNWTVELLMACPQEAAQQTRGALQHRRLAASSSAAEKRTEPKCRNPNANGRHYAGRFSLTRIARMGSLRLGEFRQALTTQRLPQFEQAACLDLANAFARNAVGSRHFLQRPRLAVAQAETQLDHLALARRQGTQYLGDALTQQVLIDL